MCTRLLLYWTRSISSSVPPRRQLLVSLVTSAGEEGKSKRAEARQGKEPESRVLGEGFVHVCARLCILDMWMREREHGEWGKRMKRKRDRRNNESQKKKKNELKDNGIAF